MFPILATSFLARAPCPSFGGCHELQEARANAAATTTYGGRRGRGGDEGVVRGPHLRRRCSAARAVDRIVCSGTLGRYSNDDDEQKNVAVMIERLLECFRGNDEALTLTDAQHQLRDEQHSLVTVQHEVLTQLRANSDAVLQAQVETQAQLDTRLEQALSIPQTQLLEQTRAMEALFQARVDTQTEIREQISAITERVAHSERAVGARVNNALAAAQIKTRLKARIEAVRMKCAIDERIQIALEESQTESRAREKQTQLAIEALRDQVQVLTQSYERLENQQTRDQHDLIESQAQAQARFTAYTEPATKEQARVNAAQTQMQRQLELLRLQLNGDRQNAPSKTCSSLSAIIAAMQSSERNAKAERSHVVVPEQQTQDKKSPSRSAQEISIEVSTSKRLEVVTGRGSTERDGRRQAPQSCSCRIASGSSKAKATGKEKSATYSKKRIWEYEAERIVIKGKKRKYYQARKRCKAVDDGAYCGVALCG